jgi:starch-binding outer membrane protein, SusD/RagB family
MRKMTSYTAKNGVRSRFQRITTLAAALAVAAGGPLAITACAPSDMLVVETPDIIDPTDVQSAAGANAVRVGALARFVQATTGTESLIMLGGLMSDEWVNGDTFIARHELDRRDVNDENTFLTTAARNLHRARLSAEQAIALMSTYLPNAPRWQVAEMHLILAYLENLAAEHYCDGLVFSTIVDGTETYGTPVTTVAAFEQALGHAAAGLQLITGTTANDQRVRHALQVTRGRILMNLNRPADAAAAVAGVPSSFSYKHFHSAGTFNNVMWTWNVNARRYSVSNREGQNGLDFATANDPRLPVCEAPCPAIGVSSATREDASRPLHVQMLWTNRDAPVDLIDGIAARMIEAEAAFRAGNAAGMMQILNAARTTVDGLDPLTDPGTDAARQALLFRERAFWHYGIGQRFGDLRRLVRQYGMPANSVWPTGDWHKAGGTYGNDVNIPVPFAESNNPNVSSTQLCMNRNP